MLKTYFSCKQISMTYSEKKITKVSRCLISLSDAFPCLDHKPEENTVAPLSLNESQSRACDSNKLRN